MLTDTQLAKIMPHLPQAKRALFLPFLNQAMATYGVNTMLRTAAFVAQLAHESGEFRFMEELWGPTDAQRRYEPPSTLATRLGNTQAGDGKRFKGRGPIQITGRFNYKKYGDLLGVDLTSQPDLAATPAIAFATAGLYWKTNGLNELADKDDFLTITRRINGGTNGLADRQKYYAAAKGVLVTDFVADAPAVATRGARTAPSRSAAPSEPLSRGFEAIRAVKAPAKRLAAKPGVKKRAATGAKPRVAKSRVAKPAKKAAPRTGAKKARASARRR